MNELTTGFYTTDKVALEIEGKRPAPAAAHEEIVEEICNLNWSGLSTDELTNIAWAYYYFSVQFRENLLIARELHPEDELLGELECGECDTDNLSPYPGVVKEGERVNHDEFMRRTLQLDGIEDNRRRFLEEIGAEYLARVRAFDKLTKASTLASYENGGLESVFGSILRARHWDSPLLQAFRHFLEKHIELDSDEEAGHGALCRHLPPTGGVAELWSAFKASLVRAAPALE
jgi:hypothetical protein